jgi:hypothetical protein
MLPALTGMTDMCLHTQLFSAEMGSPKLTYLPRLTLNGSPFNLSLPSGWIGVNHWFLAQFEFLCEMLACFVFADF